MLRNCPRSMIRLFSTSTRNSLRKIQETTEGNVTEVSVVDVPDKNPNAVYFSELHVQREPKYKMEENDKLSCEPDCPCGLCAIPVRISYKDVLILEQFMREDGTCLPRQLTGLCEEQQSRLERCVMQAHWSGLFPDKTIAEFDRSGYKRFNRHWKDDMAMFELELKTLPGNWFYIKRYNPRAAEYRSPLKNRRR